MIVIARASARQSRARTRWASSTPRRSFGSKGLEGAGMTRSRFTGNSRRACGRATAMSESKLSRRSAVKVVGLKTPALAGGFASMVLLLHGAPAAAGCPVALQSLALAGKGASGHSVMYLATAAVASPAQSSARVEIRTASGSETQTLAFEPGAAGAAKLWFSRADANAVSAKILSVESADGAVTKCTGAAVAIAPPGENAIVTVYDDAQPRSGLPDEAEFQHTRKLKGSDIRTKVQPEYPEHAQETNLVGAVDVEIVIDAAGKPAYAWVRDRETTNNTTEFDQPSLYAALHSTYVPTMQDGRPIVKAYLIEYTYMLDSDMTGSPPTPRPIDEHDLCPLVISNMRVENSDTRDAKAWYSFSLDAEDAKPTSAVIGIRDSKGAVTGLAWNNFHLGTVASD